MKRHMLEPVGDASAAQVVRRLCGVQAQVASAADLAVRLRQTDPRPGEVSQALAEGRLIKTWAMRGTLHLLEAGDAASYLALMAAGRTWERPSWQRYFGVTPKDWETIRPAVREALDGQVLTRDELIAAVTARTGFGHLAEALRSGWGTLLKPLAWQGDLCFGPSRGNSVTFGRPDSISPGWTGLPVLDEAAARAIEAYVSAYGPATALSFSSWLARGWLGKRLTDRWFAAAASRLAEVDVEGEPAYVLAEHVDELASTAPSDAVRLLGGFDQWVLGPGTDDGHVTPAARRAAVSKQSGWIAQVAIAGGVVSGTWELRDGRVAVTWFGEAGPAPADALAVEAERLGSILGRALDVSVEA
jgi:hypothetical protein